MAGHVGRRLLAVVPLVLGVLTVVFAVLQLAPGDPTARFQDPSISPEVALQMRRSFGLDQPVPVQYVRWLGAFAQGDLGYSFGQGRPIAEILPGVIWNTLQLTLPAFVLSFGLGIAVGVFQAVRRRSATDHALTVMGLVLYSIPVFWLALMLVLVFSLKASSWGWPVSLPASQMTSPNHDLLGPLAQLGDRLAHLLLPVLVLGIGSAAGVARYVRSSMLEVIGEDYIRTARAKGLSERVVIYRHALRNALLPVIGLIGVAVPYLLGGAVLVETIFAWPGMGRLTVDAVLQRDYPLVMATTAVIALMVVLGSLLADLLYAAADPRIRTE